MPPQPRLCPQCNHLLPKPHRPFLLKPQHARTASAITPAFSPAQSTTSAPPIARYPPTQPPSHRLPQNRKSQLHRQYTSLLRSTPLLLLFQHNNLKSTEWMSIRRELTLALRKVDDVQASQQGRFGLVGGVVPMADSIKIQILQTSIFASALLVAEYFHPHSPSSLPSSPSPTPPASASQHKEHEEEEENFTHALSRLAHTTTRPHKYTHPLHPLLSGPLAALSFPTVSPAHLATALSILAPTPKSGAFPPPKRSQNPGYYEPVVQSGLSKLMLLGARVEGRVLDGEGVRWVGGIEGGMEGLRAGLVGVLGGVGVGLVGGLEGVGRGLWGVMEGRRGMLEEEEKAREGGSGGGDGA